MRFALSILIVTFILSYVGIFFYPYVEKIFKKEIKRIDNTLNKKGENNEH